MFSLLNPSKRKAAAEQSLRGGERYAQNQIACPLGTVTDMSCTGLRLRTSKKPPVDVGQVLLLDLIFGQGKLAIKGQVRWWRRTGLRKYDVGLKFVRIKPGAQALLESLARDGRVPISGRNKAKTSRQKGTTITVQTQLPNYYRVLGLPLTADAETIHRRFRKLAARLHPDVNPDPDARESFQRLCDAYHVLSDARRREAYTSLVA